MKQKLIIVRGAPASGKTTIGENLRDIDNNIVWFKTDNIKPFFSEYKKEHLDQVMEACYVTLSHLLDKGYTVIYEGIFIKQKYVEQAKEIAKSKNIPYAAFQLKCSLSTLQERDRSRKGVKEGCRKRLGDEVIESIYKKVEDNPIDDATSLDTEKNDLGKCISIIKKEIHS